MVSEKKSKKNQDYDLNGNVADHRGINNFLGRLGTFPRDVACGSQIRIGSQLEIKNVPACPHR